MNHHALKSTRSLASACDKQTGHHTMILHLVGENVWHETPCCNAFCQHPSQASWAWQTPSKRILRGSNVFSFFSTGTLHIPWFYLARQFWKTFNRYPSADLILELDVMSGAVRRWGGQGRPAASASSSGRWRGFNDLAGQVDWRPEAELISELGQLWSKNVPMPRLA